MAAEYKKLVLKANEEKRILDGEFWVYDNEIAGSLKPFQGGELCRLYSSTDMYIATGYVNPASTITFRVLSLDADVDIDRAFLLKRIREADSQRLALRPENSYYRMVYGEADFLPGLVIDRFDDYFIVQITTAGMENFKADILAIVSAMYPQASTDRKIIDLGPGKRATAILQPHGHRGPSCGKGHHRQRSEIQDRFFEKPEDGIFP